MSGHRTARVLIYTHRWLGIALGFLFIIWFASGIVMIYARMPALDPIERLARLPAISPESIRVDPPAPDGEVSRFTVGTLEGRPLYKMTTSGRTHLIFADTGDDVPPVDSFAEGSNTCGRGWRLRQHSELAGSSGRRKQGGRIDRPPCFETLPAVRQRFDRRRSSGRELRGRQPSWRRHGAKSVITARCVRRGVLKTDLRGLKRPS